MTEQKAIETIKYASAFNSDNSPLTKALDIAIKALEEIQQYRKLEKQELLLRLPCKVGTPVYMITMDCGGDTLDCRCGDCDGCRYLYGYLEQNSFEIYMLEEIGKSVFLTEEEAEQKLSEIAR